MTATKQVNTSGCGRAVTARDSRTVCCGTREPTVVRQKLPIGLELGQVTLEKAFALWRHFDFSEHATATGATASQQLWPPTLGLHKAVPLRSQSRIGRSVWDSAPPCWIATKILDCLRLCSPWGAHQAPHGQFQTLATKWSWLKLVGHKTRHERGKRTLTYKEGMMARLTEVIEGGSEENQKQV